jgi:hypothetical protein
MKPLLRKPKRPIQYQQTISHAQTEEAGVRAIVAHEMFIAGLMLLSEIPAMRYDAKREYDALWRQAMRCREMFSAVPENMDDFFHEAAAKGVQAALDAMLEFTEQHEPLTT